MKRKIYQELINWKNKDSKPLIVLGVRQCGKTYIIDEFCKKEFKQYCYINLFRNKEIIELYNSNKSSIEKYNELKLILDFDFEKENSIVFIDEIQESEELISELKYFCEEHSNIKIICAGSLLGVKLKRSHFSSPVGKVRMIKMFPMDFEEFLWAMNKEILVNHIRDCFINNKAMNEPLHSIALRLYRTFIITGGMPESILSMINAKEDYTKYNENTLNDIIESYFNDMKKYVISDVETLKIRRLYNSLPNQLSNESCKFQYSKIEKQARKRNYELSLDWLIASNLVITANNVTLPEIPLEGFKDPETFKIYLSDVGILKNILKIKMIDILNDNISLYKGVITENYVANQLVINGYNLYYWKNNESEIDFLLYNNDGIIPVEVKAADNTKSKSLKIYMEKYKPPYAIRISTKDFGFDPKTNIKSIPLYAVFLI